LLVTNSDDGKRAGKLDPQGSRYVRRLLRIDARDKTSLPHTAAARTTRRVQGSSSPRDAAAVVFTSYGGCPTGRSAIPLPATIPEPPDGRRNEGPAPYRSHNHADRRADACRAIRHPRGQCNAGASREGSE